MPACHDGHPATLTLVGARMTTKRPWMPIYWGDYLHDTQHLTAEQHGAYLLLIAYYWQNGCLPRTVAERQIVSRIGRGKWKKTWNILRTFWDENEHHSRIDFEIAKTENINLHRTLAGKRGGQTRKQMLQANARLNGVANAQAIASHTSHKKDNLLLLNREAKSMKQTDPGYDEALKHGSPDLQRITQQQNKSRGIDTPARPATALANGAPSSLAPNTSANSTNKPPHEVSIHELQAIYLRQKSGMVNPAAKVKDDDDEPGIPFD